MNHLSSMLYILFPFVGGVLLILGLKLKRINYILSALWLCLIALLLHYQTAGSEILGNYFNYNHAAIYTLNVLVLLTALLCLFLKYPPLQSKYLRYLSTCISACLVVGGLLLLINVWMNAYFIENRRPGTPVLQVAAFNPLPYCNYRYIFYKVGQDGKIYYMCPNYYGMIPSLGQIDLANDFISNHFLPRQ